MWPEGSQVEIEARLGDNPVPIAAAWSPFESVANFSRTWCAPAGRYLQFKIVMYAHNPLVTPVFKGISVEGEVPRAPSTAPIDVTTFSSSATVASSRPSLPYVHEDFARLNELRHRFELDAMVSGAATEFEAQLQLMHWALQSGRSVAWMPTNGITLICLDSIGMQVDAPACRATTRNADADGPLPLL